ncbi:MAG: insulinase family protein [Bdellovibrionales bacterium]|nr:insulinase family protein [Bdellovibrionales bacterium]
MKQFIRNALLCSLLLFLPVFGVQADENQSPFVGSAPLEKLKASVKKFTLANGLRVIIYPRKVAPVFSAYIGIRVGGVNEVIGNTGISHLLEHMAFKGTPYVGTKDYAREKPLLEELDRYLEGKRVSDLSEEDRARVGEIYEELSTIWVSDEFTSRYRRRGGAGLNATTAKEMTSFFVSFPRSSFEFWCLMESERLLRPIMRQFYKERDVVMEERRMRYEDDPSGKLYEMILGQVYLSHSYRNPVIGYASDIMKLSRLGTKEFHDQYYVPSNIVVSLVGDIDPDRDMDLIERYFGRLTPGVAPAQPTAVEPPQEGERRLVLEHPSEPQLYVAYRKAQFPDPDDAKISVMLEILGGSNVAPLYKSLVEQKKLATSIDYFEAPGVAYPNLVFFASAPRKPHTNEDLLRAFDEVLAKFMKHPPTEKDVSVAKRRMLMQYLTKLDSNMGLAEDFTSSELIHGDWKVLFEWYDQVMKVTPEDVLAVARRYLVPRGRTVATIETVASGEGVR